MISYGEGRLYYGQQVDGGWDEREWTPLGEVTECDLRYGAEDEVGEVWRTGGYRASVSFPLRIFSPEVFWLLFRRRHPRLRQVRHAYRTRRGMRRFR